MKHSTAQLNTLEIQVCEQLSIADLVLSPIVVLAQKVINAMQRAVSLVAKKLSLAVLFANLDNHLAPPVTFDTKNVDISKGPDAY